MRTAKSGFRAPSFLTVPYGSGAGLLLLCRYRFVMELALNTAWRATVCDLIADLQDQENTPQATSGGALDSYWEALGY